MFIGKVAYRRHFVQCDGYGVYDKLATIDRPEGHGRSSIAGRMRGGGS